MHYDMTGYTGDWGVAHAGGTCRAVLRPTAAIEEKIGNVKGHQSRPRRARRSFSIINRPC